VISSSWILPKSAPEMASLRPTISPRTGSDYTFTQPTASEFSGASSWRPGRPPPLFTFPQGVFGAFAVTDVQPVERTTCWPATVMISADVSPQRARLTAYDRLLPAPVHPFAGSSLRNAFCPQGLARSSGLGMAPIASSRGGPGHRFKAPFTSESVVFERVRTSCSRVGGERLCETS